MIEIVFVLKFVCLLLAGVYAVPVLLGGALHGRGVSNAQTWFFTVGWVGFVMLQWFIK